MSQITAYPQRSQSPETMDETRWTVTSVQPSRREAGQTRPQNISDMERWASAIGGSALLLLGLPRGGLTGLLSGLVGGSLIYRGATGHCHLYEALGYNTSTHHNPATAVPAQQGVKIERTIAVNRSPEELYRFWRNFENLPRIMSHLERVEQIDDNRSHWCAKGPFGKTVEWKAEIITDREPEVISWRSLEDSEVSTAGSVHFKPLGGDRGTAVSISLKYDPPGGKLGASVASLFGQGLEQELDHDLHEFKSMMEAGEAPTTDGQPHG